MYQSIFFICCLGIKAKRRTVSNINTVIECPDGKLVLPDKVSPIILKLLWSKTAAGLGTAKNLFSNTEIKAEKREAGIKLSHTFGLYTKKILRNDKEITSSPSCVRLMSVFGYSDNVELI